jgi:hypothetical protein
MGKPRSVFNGVVDTNRKIAKNFGQFRQNITGMSSTFRGMPANPPKVSSGETTKVGGDTEKTKVQYLESLRIDKDTRIDFSTVGGGAGITSTVASGQFIDFKIGATSLLNIGPTNVTFKNTVLAPAIDFGSLSSRLGTIYCDALDVDNDIKVSGDIILGDSTASDTIDITALFITPLNINGQNMFFDVDRDSKIYSGSDDSIKINTGGILRMEVNNSGVGIDSDLQVTGEFELTSSGIPTSTLTSITSFTGDLHYNALVNDSHFFKVDGTTEVEIDADGIDIRNGWLELEERNEPSAPTTNHCRIFAQELSGKTRLMVRFPSGFSQQIAIEP